jgi:2-polyprenyl-3-methyl-5-hydroxy-6-metoxy-1,4-benzoquinol methylase
MNDYKNDLTVINSILKRGLDENGSPRPFTDEEFFSISHQIGANQFNSNYRKLFENLSKWAVRVFDPKKSLEIGSGPGYLLYYLNSLGVDAIGIDGNEFSKNLYSRLHPEYNEKYFIDKTFSGEYGEVDLLFAIECFEHINDADLFSIMTKLSAINKPKKIIFSSTPFFSEIENWDFQWGHINIKSKLQWIDFFAQFNYKKLDLIPPVTEWALAFELIE